MSSTKYLKGCCQSCGGHLEFPADQIGLTADCPHCGQQTELMLPAPPEEPSVPRRALVWTGVAVLVAVLGLVGAMIALHRVERWAAGQRQAGVVPSAPAATNTEPLASADPLAQAGFSASEIKLQHASGSSLVYAVGTIRNTANRPRFGVRLELDLLDAAGEKVGTAKDYVATLEARGEWHFQALVVEPKGVMTAKVASLKEDQ
jgi:hypothetical protein